MAEPRISLYFHCKSCFEAGRQQKLAVGWTKEGIQVFCETDNMVVTDLDFMGQKIDYYQGESNEPKSN